MIFGTDGIRGTAYDTLPLSIAFSLGVAITQVFQDHVIYVGHDPRASSLDYVKALMRGLKQHRREVYHVGMVTTPMLAWYTHEKKAVGIMVTASHNPFKDNGLKVLVQGKKLDEATEKLLSTWMSKEAYDDLNDSSVHSLSIEDEYLHYLNQQVPLETSINYGIDCANGASSFIVKKALNGHTYYDQPNGQNINLNCGATHVEALKQIALSHDVAFAYDGDGDRLMMAIQDHILDGNMIIYLLFKARVQKGQVALSVMTNPGLIHAFKAAGATITLTPVGDKYLHEALQQGAILGAEASGHIVLKEMPFGDAIYMTRLMLSLIEKLGLNVLLNWIHEVKLVPMKTMNFKYPKTILEDPYMKQCLSQIENNHPKNHTWIIRPSGTEALIRVTVSHDTESELHHALQLIESCFKGGLK